jgi:hypothetical protein
MRTCNPDQVGRHKQETKRTNIITTTRKVSPLSHRTKSQMGQWKANEIQNKPKRNSLLSLPSQLHKMVQYEFNHIIKWNSKTISPTFSTHDPTHIERGRVFSVQSALRLYLENRNTKWATMSLRDINTGTWPSRLGESKKLGQYTLNMVMSPMGLRPERDCAGEDK